MELQFQTSFIISPIHDGYVRSKFAGLAIIADCMSAFGRRLDFKSQNGSLSSCKSSADA